MDSKKLRDNIQINIKNRKKSDSYYKYEITLSLIKINKVSQVHNISENEISFAFENYTPYTDVELYIKSYRPDSKEKFMISSESSLVNIKNLYISEDIPKNIAPYKPIKITIIAKYGQELDNPITIVPYIDGISSKKNIKIPSQY